MKSIIVKKINMYFGRGKNKLQVDYGLDDFYNLYLSKGGTIPKTKFRKVWVEFSEKLWDMIINKNYEFIIPYRLGTLRMKSYKIPMRLDEHGELKTVKMAADYKATLDYWEQNSKARENKEIIFFFNEHSDGYQSKILWDKSTCITKNHKKYAFKPSRANKRKVAKTIKENKTKYYE